MKNWKNILILQGIVMIFSLTSVVAKFASAQEIFTKEFFLFYGLEIVILGVYALLWQQSIKKFDISIAYANKAMVLLWGVLWSIVIFHDGISLKQAIGVVLVIIGVMILNQPPVDESGKGSPSENDTDGIGTGGITVSAGREADDE